nr:MAG TPA: hypothetical protein [Caudoviricetes sp.]
MQLEWGVRIRPYCLQWCPFISRPYASPRSQLLDRRLWAGGFFVAITRLTGFHLAILGAGLNPR